MAGGFMGVIKQIIKFFKSVQKRFSNLGKGLTGMGGAMGAGVTALGDVFKIGGRSIVFNVGAMLEVLMQYTVCTGEFIIKLPQCFALHIITAIFTLAYFIFFKLPILIIELCLGISLKREVDLMWHIIRSGDDVIYGLTGLYLTQLPPSLVKMCYTCKGGRKYSLDAIDRGQAKITRAGKNINRDFKVKVSKLFRRPKTKMDDSIKKIKKTFS
jgi:hypothetical protein